MRSVTVSVLLSGLGWKLVFGYRSEDTPPPIHTLLVRGRWEHEESGCWIRTQVGDNEYHFDDLTHLSISIARHEEDTCLQQYSMAVADKIICVTYSNLFRPPCNVPSRSILKGQIRHPNCRIHIPSFLEMGPLPKSDI